MWVFLLERIYGRWSRGADPRSFREGKETENDSQMRQGEGLGWRDRQKAEIVRGEVSLNLSLREE